MPNLISVSILKGVSLNLAKKFNVNFGACAKINVENEREISRISKLTSDD